jgi:hypothetical protein
MSRWLTLTADDLKAAGHGAIVDRARTLAVGSVDPVQEAISNVTAQVQRAIATGNVLDADTTKIPLSYKGLAEALVINALSQRIGLVTPDARNQADRPYLDELKSTAKNKLKCEEPDTPATAPLMQPTGMKVTGINVPRRMTGRERTRGL